MTLENGILNRKSGFRNPRNFCLWNLEYSSRNSESHWQLEYRIQVPLHWQRLESSTWNQESKAWNPESKIVLDSLIVRRFEARMSSKDCATVWRQKKSNVVTKYIITSYTAFFWIPDTLWLHCRSWWARKTTVSKRRVRNEQQHNTILISLTMCFYYSATRAYGV